MVALGRCSQTAPLETFLITLEKAFESLGNNNALEELF